MSEPRKARISVDYEGKNITDEIKEFIQSFTYIDIANGESDSISIELVDQNKKWIGKWFPTKGDKMRVKIVVFNWTKDSSKKGIACGDFLIDDLSFNGSPLSCSIGAVSIPQNEAFNNRNRTKTWEKITVEKIAEEIAKKAKLKLYYEAERITIKSIEQNQEPDCKFLYSVCKEYGLAMKVFSKKLVIFDEEKYEKKKAVTTIKESQMIAWTYNTTIAGTYTGAKISFTDPDDDKEHTVKIGSGNRILEKNITADSISDAEKKGTALLSNENKKATTMTVSIMANPKIVASACVNIAGLNKIDGKYYIEKVKHRISGKENYEMTLEIRLVSSRGKPDSKKKPETEKNKGNGYTVLAGDSLWKIAKKLLGDGSLENKIYEANKETIEAAAKKRGKNNSSSGKWIYPGTNLKIP